LPFLKGTHSRGSSGGNGGVGTEPRGCGGGVGLGEEGDLLGGDGRDFFWKDDEFGFCGGDWVGEGVREDVRED